MRRLKKKYALVFGLCKLNEQRNRIIRSGYFLFYIVVIVIGIIDKFFRSKFQNSGCSTVNGFFRFPVRVGQ